MSRFSKHLNTGEPLEIEGEKYYLKGLGVERYKDIFSLMKKIVPVLKEKGKDTMTGNELSAALMDVLDDKTMVMLQDLVMETLRVSYPDEKDEAEMKQFAMKYFWLLVFKMIEVNSAKDISDNSESAKRQEAIAKITQRNDKPTG